jgi:5-methylcytosine-specific restriction endonuclease McrA
MSQEGLNMIEQTEMNGLDGQGQRHHVGKKERPTGDVWAVKLKDLLEWQEYRCALSGRELTPSNAEADHIIPVKHGGVNQMENIQILTHEVNRAKGTLSHDEFVSLCRDVNAYCSLDDQ